jgi:hypothetical protein
MAPKRHRSSLCCAALLIAIVAATAMPVPAAAAYAKLSGVLPPGATVVSFLISPDGKYVVYGLGQAGDSPGAILQLYSVPIAVGAAPVLLAQTNIPAYRITPDSSQVIFVGPGTAEHTTALYSVPIAGPSSAVTQLSDPDTTRAISDFKISPDSRWVVFLDNTSSPRLYSVSISAPVGIVAQLNTDTGIVAQYQITPDSQRVIFTDFNSGYQVLYSLPIEGPGSAATRLSVGADGSVWTFAITPDSAWVAYRASWMMVPSRLYRVAAAGRDESARMISGSVTPTGRIGLTPDGGRVIFEARPAGGGPLDIYSVALDDPNFVAKLSASPDSSRSVDDFLASPDSAWVIYRADHDLAGTAELYGAPLLWPSPPLKLNDPLAAGGSVASFRIAPDGAIVYLADQEVDERAELFSLRGANQTGATRVNDALVAGGGVRAFLLNPNRDRVVYLADRETDEVVELYSAYTWGMMVGGDPSFLKLSGPQVPGGEVLDFDLTSDGARVVYIADQELDGIAELYMADFGPFRVGFENTTLSVPESAGVVSIPVRLAEASVGTVSVNYAVTGGNATETDFSLAPGPAVFAPGETLTTIGLTVHDDDAVEAGEWFELSLGGTTGAYLQYPFSLTIHIVDDDDGDVAKPVGHLLYLPLTLH